MQIPARVYAMVIALTTFSAVLLGVAGPHMWTPELKGRTLLLAAAITILISAGEFFATDLPQTSVHVTMSVSSSLCLAAAVTFGPLFGALVAGIGALIVELMQRRAPIKLCVNVNNYIVSVFVAGWTYTQLADLSRTPISSAQNIIATLVTVAVFDVVSTGLMAIILSQVVATTPYRVWRNNMRGVAFETFTLPIIGALVPVLYAQSPFAVLFVVIPLLGPYLSVERYAQIHRETRSTIELVADMLDRRDPYTAEHSKRVSEYVSMIIAEMPSLTFEDREVILAAAPVHDIGKIGTTDFVLSKPGKLTDEEREIIKRHAAEGASILGILSMYQDVSVVVRHHHERWDGRGYPDGLFGEDIPVGSRVIAVADTYDAMTSDRVYRKALSRQVALAEIRRGSGTQFDPTVVNAFLRVMQGDRIAVEVAEFHPA